MTLEKAIKILTIDNDHNPEFTDADRCEAHQLGIEAMKDLNAERNVLTALGKRLLPGETED